MGLFDLFKNDKLKSQSKEENKNSSAIEVDKSKSKEGNKNSSDIEIDKSKWLGKDFELLIAGEIDIPSENFDSIMTPNSFDWIKTERNNWIYYQVGDDNFNYSFEPPGIQMVFNDEISFAKAKAIVDEIIQNIIATGQTPELIIIEKNKLYRFE
ncbi:MAG TPA: hypothetical protein VHB54_07005 [Mucilaginibacter sp.]|nr:hypothetical protein [Mucilaginibacter sp.]